jgi:hypothetical protein
LGYDTGITYEQLARTPDNYVDKKVKFTGTVMQVVEDDVINQIRMAVDSDYDQILYAIYKPSIVATRILEGDTITIYGVSKDLYTYEATSGMAVTIPNVTIDKIELKE